MRYLLSKLVATNLSFTPTQMAEVFDLKRLSVYQLLTLTADLHLIQHLIHPIGDRDNGVR